MKVTPAALPGVLLVEPKVFQDERGFFFESYHAERYFQFGLPKEFVQDNQSRSVRGTLRGLHGQLQKPQGKLVRVTQGEIFDVAVDARPDSPTFGKWVGEILTSQNFRQLYAPPGFLHGFCVLSPVAEVEYKCTDYYAPGDEVGVIWNDPRLEIAWPVPDPILSPKDKALPTFDSLGSQFEIYRGKK
ncbi:MAG TPA: dTDP-4-dehydrorhamnose 3,5-epimerase [bacterium]|nr:dTDP-4-dehydrorhamnose 3,5-epimerase [bacterium]